MRLLPEFDGLTIEQKTYKAFGNEYHAYQVNTPNDAYPCGRCANCGKGKPCRGLPSVTSISGQYGGGGLYPAGYRHALDAVFGEYTDKAKDAVKEDSWFSDYLRSGFQTKSSVAHNRYRHYMFPKDIIRYRQEVEEIPCLLYTSPSPRD